MPAVKTVMPSGNAAIDGLLTGQKWGVTSLTFGFPLTASSYGLNYGSGENTSLLAALNAAQQEAVRTVLTLYADVVPLAFRESLDLILLSPDLRFGESSSMQTAWGYGPQTRAEGGDVWFSNNGTYDAPTVGTYAFDIFLHEIGHALGLKHPHETSGAFKMLPASRDSVEFTVMSYRSFVGASTSAGLGGEFYGLPQTPMMDDIAALQYLYGADYSTRPGNTVYAWRPESATTFIDGKAAIVPGGPRVFLTIWDGGGVDTYDFSAYATGVKVDLAPGAWSTASTAQLAYLGSGKVARGNIANALLYQNNTVSLIENATGGSGNDVIVGNQAANTLRGGDGKDSLDGQTGNDTLYGGLGDDVLAGGAGDDSQFGEAGNDTIQGGDGNDTGDGGDGNDTITLEAGNDRGLGGAGNDRLVGGDGNDSLSGGTGNDTLQGGSGNDVLTGDNDVDQLSGDAGNDTLKGGNGNDRLSGGAGVDLLQGNAGNDTLTGDADADGFIFLETVWGIDRITDFQDGQGVEDLIQVSRTTFASFNAIRAAMVQVGADVHIVGASGSEIHIANTKVAAFGADDFVFA